MSKSTITVSTEVKAMVENEAKAVCNTSKVALDDFNQDLNAITAYRCLLKSGATMPGEPDKFLQILKKMGNASALRQAITAVEEKKTAVANAIAADLLKPTK